MMAKIIGFLALLALDIPVLILRGFVLSQLWLWFLVPLGVPVVGIAQAIGISLLVSMLTVSSHKSSDDDDFWTGAIGNLLKSLLMSLLAWGMGAIVHSFA
jgi:hypothetical protein